MHVAQSIQIYSSYRRHEHVIHCWDSPSRDCKQYCILEILKKVRPDKLVFEHISVIIRVYPSLSAPGWHKRYRHPLEFQQQKHNHYKFHKCGSTIRGGSIRGGGGNRGSTIIHSIFMHFGAIQQFIQVGRLTAVVICEEIRRNFTVGHTVHLVLVLRQVTSEVAVHHE